MDALQQYILQTIDNRDRGELPNYPDPAPPTDLDTPFTQTEIDKLKTLLKELDRFTPSNT